PPSPLDSASELPGESYYVHTAPRCSSMIRVVSLRLRNDQMERLQRAATRLGRSPSQSAALLLEESLRQRDYPFIEFRDSPAGRQAYLQGTRIAVWHVASIAREYEADASKVAAHLEIPEIQ